MLLLLNHRHCPWHQTRHCWSTEPDIRGTLSTGLNLSHGTTALRTNQEATPEGIRWKVFVLQLRNMTQRETSSLGYLKRQVYSSPQPLTLQRPVSHIQGAAEYSFQFKYLFLIFNLLAWRLLKRRIKSILKIHKKEKKQNYGIIGDMQTQDISLTFCLNTKKISWILYAYSTKKNPEVHTKKHHESDHLTIHWICIESENVKIKPRLCLGFFKRKERTFPVLFL